MKLTLPIATVTSATKKYTKALAKIDSPDDLEGTLRIYDRRGYELASSTGTVTIVRPGIEYIVGEMTVTKRGGCACGGTKVTEI